MKLAAREALRAPRLPELARLDDAAFRALFTKSAVKRIGRERFVRNVLIAIGNSADASLAGEAERLLDDPSPLVRGAAVWALGRLDPRAARAAPREIAPARPIPTSSRNGPRRGAIVRHNGHAHLFRFRLSRGTFRRQYGEKFDRIIGTVRGAERAAILNAYDAGGCKALVFDGKQATPELHSAIAEADPVLVSVPPGREWRSGAARRAARRWSCARSLREIVYLSTIGVYGDRGGEWVDEDNAGRAGVGAQPRAARRRTGLAGARRAQWHRRRGPASRRHLWAGPERTGADRARQRAAASSNPGRSSTASMSPTSRKRSMPRSRARRPGFSTSPTTSRRRPAIRSSLPRSFWASRRRRKFRSSKRRRRCRRWR